MQPISNNDEMDLTIPQIDTAVAAWEAERIELAGQWIQHAQEHQDDPEIVGQALANIKHITDELAENKGVTLAVLTGLQEVTIQLAEQRNTAMHKYKRLAAETDSIRDQAFQDGIEVGESSVIMNNFEDLDPDYATDVSKARDEDFIEEAGHIADILRTKGEADMADALEMTAGAVVENRASAELLLAEAREKVYLLRMQQPGEAAPIVDDLRGDDEDEEDEDEPEED